jgi:acetyl-CoA C-acetyltransferase
MKRVAVVGVGQTSFGEKWNKSMKDLIVEAGFAAIKDASLEEKPQSLYLGSMSSGRFVGQEHTGAIAADCLGLKIPATRCEAACASGSLAFRSAYHAIASGECDIAIVLGVEKMTDLKTSDTVASLALAGDQEWEASVGLTFAGLYALMARAHMNKYGTTREQLAMVSVNNHKNAVGNKYAQFPFAITLEQVIKSTMIADPLTLLDCSPITDGAAALILTSENIAKKTDNPVWLLGSGQASDTVALHDRSSFTEIAAAEVAGKIAMKQAEITQKDINVLEVHDCFSINEILSLESLGFCEKGMGGKFVESGEIKNTGIIPTNTTGGLKAGGHPVGATGIRQIIDIVRQLRGVSHNQIKGARYGANLNVGGSGATAVVNIFGV